MPDPDLEDAIVDSYPAPVAIAYRAMTEQVEPAAALACLLDTTEGLVHYIFVVQLSAYLRAKLDLDACRARLSAAFNKDTLSTSETLELLHLLVSTGGAELAAQSPYPLHGLLLTPAREASPVMKKLAALAELRSQERSRDDGANDEALLCEHRARLDEVLGAMGFLADWTLVRPVELDDDGRITHADLLMGERRKRARPFEVPLDDQDVEMGVEQVRAEKLVLLVAPDRARYVPLFPFSLFPVQLRGQGMFLLRGLSWSRRGQAWALHGASYVAYDRSLKSHEERSGDATVHALERALSELGLEQGHVAAPPDQASPEVAAFDVADPDVELPEVAVEQAFHVQAFVGRGDLLEEVSAWIERPGPAAFLLLHGGPGQGKSALLAELARRQQAIGGALLHMVKSHRSARRFVPALIRQAAREADHRFGAAAYVGGDDDLRNALVAALTLLHQRRGRAVLVIDGLDELDAAGRSLRFLPRTLPDGVRVVLSARDDMQLRQRLGAHVGTLTERALPGLDRSDVTELVERFVGEGPAAELDLTTVLDKVAGSPLLLRRTLERLERELDAGAEPRDLDLDRYPTTHHAMFREIYDELAKEDGNAAREGGDKAALIEIMSVAREPLTIEQLGRLLAARGHARSLEEVRDRIVEMSPYLLDVGGERFQPWHQGLRDFVVEQVLGPTAVRDEEARFLRGLDPMSRYALRHGVDHRLAAGLHDEARALIRDPLFVEARVQAGMSYELARELAELEDGDPLLVTLADLFRRHAGLLARHPEVLASLVHALGHWHDPDDDSASSLRRWADACLAALAPRPWLRSLRAPAEPLGGELGALLRGHEGRVEGVAFSPDDATVASVGSDGTLRLWSASTGASLDVIRACESGRAPCLAYSPDGARLATGGEDGSIHIFSADGQALQTLRGHRKLVNDLAFAPDGRLLVSGSWDRTVAIWADGELVRSLGTGPVFSVAISPDGTWMAVASIASSLEAFALPSGERLWYREVTHTIEGLTFRADGALLAAFVGGGLWVFDADGELERRIDLPEAPTFAAAAAGERVAAGGKSRTVFLLEGDAAPRPLRGHRSTVRCVAFSSDGAAVASGDDDGVVILWRPDRVSRAASQPEAKIAAARFSPDGHRLAVARRDGGVQLWSCDEVRVEETFTGHRDAVLDVAFSRDGRLLASASLDHTARLFTVQGREVACLEGHEAPVRSVAFSRDGSRVVTGARDFSVQIWSVFGGRRLARLEHRSSVVAVATSEDRVFAMGRQGELAAWSLLEPAPSPVLSASIEVPSHVTDMRASPDGSAIALCLRDGSVGVWSIDERAWTAEPGRGPIPLDSVLAEDRPRYAARAQGEVVVVEDDEGRRVVTYPFPLGELRAHPGGRAWVGWTGHHLQWFRLEDG